MGTCRGWWKLRGRPQHWQRLRFCSAPCPCSLPPPRSGFGLTSQFEEPLAALVTPTPTTPVNANFRRSRWPVPPWPVGPPLKGRQLAGWQLAMRPGQRHWELPSAGGGEGSHGWEATTVVLKVPSALYCERDCEREGDIIYMTEGKARDFTAGCVAASGLQRSVIIGGVSFSMVEGHPANVSMFLSAWSGPCRLVMKSG